MLSKLLRKPGVQAGLVFFVLLLILFNGVVFRGLTFGGGDTTAAKGMTYQLAQHFRETGEYPLWQPFIFGGMPAFSSLMFTKFVYFPNILLGLLNSIGIPVLWNMLAHYLLAALGVYFLLRLYKVDQIPAITGATAYMLSPFFIVMITAGHGSQMMTAAYLPWLLYGVVRVFRDPGLASALILAVVAGLQLQRGHVQVAYYGWMAAGLFVLVEVIDRLRRKDWKGFGPALGWFAGAMLVGLGLAMVLYLPSLSYAAYSIRGGGAGGGLDYGYATGWSFPPAELLSLLVSDWFGFGGMTYWGGKPFTEHSDFLGVAWLLLMAAAFLDRRHLKIKIYLAVGMLLALLVSFGSYWSWFYDLLFNYLPYFNKFRVPSMILILLEVFAAILAGFGLQALISHVNELRERWERTIFIKLVVLATVFVLVLLTKSGLQNWFTGIVESSPKVRVNLTQSRVDMWYGSLVWSLIVAIATTALVWAWFTRRIKLMVFSLAIPALLIVDLGRVDMRFTRTAIPAKDLKRMDQPTPAVRQLQKLQGNRPGRIMPVQQLFGGNDWAMHGLESIGGYSPAKLEVYQTFLSYQQFEQSFLLKYYNETANGITARTLDEIDPGLRKRHLDALRILNVTHLVSPYPIPEPAFRQVAESRHLSRGKPLPVVIYALEDPAPRAWFARLVTGVSDLASSRMRMSQTNFDPLQEAVVWDEAGTIATGDYSLGSVEIVERSLQRMVLKTRNQAEGFLVLSEIYYPNGWHAELADGTPLQIHRTNEIIRGLVVPSGEQTITLSYHPAAVRVGFVITLLATLLCLAAGGLLWLRRRREGSE